MAGVDGLTLSAMTSGRTSTYEGEIQGLQFERSSRSRQRRLPLPHLPSPPDLEKADRDPNISNYDGVQEYLDILYNHYLEDFLSELRNAIVDYRKKLVPVFRQSSKQKLQRGPRMIDENEYDLFYEYYEDYDYGSGLDDNRSESEDSESLSDSGASENDSSDEDDRRKVQDNNIKSGSYYKVLRIDGNKMTISVKGFSRLDDDDFWNRCELLKPGALVALSTDNFESFTYILITEDFRPHRWVRLEHQRDGHRRRRVPRVPGTRTVEVALYPSCSYDVLSSDETIWAIEPSTYFESYRHVLGRIQQLQEDPSLMPLQRYIVDQTTEEYKPPYLSRSKKRYRKEKSLNDAQKRAVDYAMNHQMVLIQGPPGTGKTFVGVSLINFLSSLNEKIVIMAFTNHAVDHFILECERSGVRTDRLVRLGGQYCEAVHEYSLEERKKQWGCRPDVVLRRANIITMTTTGASKLQSLVELAKPKIVLVEEAAHITEAHLIAGLPSTCEHLIMLGDYFQLRPNVSATARDYYLDQKCIKGEVRNGKQSPL